MASVDTIVAQLRAAVGHLHQALTRLRAAKILAEEGRNQAEALGSDGVVRRFARILDRTGELEAMLLAGVEAGEALIAQAEAIRHGGSTGGIVPAAPAAGGTAGTPGPADVPTPRPITPGWRQASEAPEQIRSAAARLRPRPPEDEERFTTGIVNDETIHSGGRDRSLAADLNHDPLRGPPVTFYDHVESKVAARMRREHREQPDKPQRVELVVDNTVCGAIAQERNYVWGCDRILPGILPRGSTLVVWSTCDGGRTLWRRAYHGTGERIRE